MRHVDERKRRALNTLAAIERHSQARDGALAHTHGESTESARAGQGRAGQGRAGLQPSVRLQLPKLFGGHGRITRSEVRTCHAPCLRHGGARARLKNRTGLNNRARARARASG